MDFSMHIATVRRSVTQFLAIATVTLATGSLLAHAETAKDNTPLNELLTLSGMYEGLSEVGNQFKAGVSQAAANKPAENEMDQMFYALADKHLSAENLAAKTRAFFTGKLSDQVIQDSLAWYRSDLAKQLTKAEETAGTQAAQEQMMQMVPTLMADEARVAFESRVLEMLNVSEMMVTMQQEIMLTLVENMAAAGANGQPVDITPIQQQVQASRPAMKAQIDQYMLVFMLFAHQTFSLEQLSKYEAYLKSASGQAYSAASLNAMTTVLTKAMDDLGKEMRVQMSAQQQKKPAA